MPIDRAQIAFLIGPLIPNRHAVGIERADIGVAGEEPQEFMDDRLQMQFLCRHKRKAVTQIKAHLMAEDRQRPGAGPVVLAHPVNKDTL